MPRKQYEFKHEPKKRPTWQKWLIGIVAAPIVIIVFLFILGSITGPTEFDDPVVESTSAVDSSGDEPSQDELNQQLKDKAIEIDFVTANAGEYEVGTKVKATGEVGLLNDDSIFPNFNLTTESDDGYGLYYVEGFNTSDAEFSNGDIVTIYGTYDGKDEQTGGPKIFVTYIEK